MRFILDYPYPYIFGMITPMSGHSKWSTIKRDKAINDAKRSQIFTKIVRAITVAVKQGGGDMDTNSALRLAVDKAKEARMPKDNIERAIQKGLGASSGDANFEEVVYEGYGPSGVAFMVKCLTDNKNRTVADIRNIFSRGEGSLGVLGCTSYIFHSDPRTLVRGGRHTVLIDNLGIAKKLENLYDLLDDHDDVTDVFANFDFTPEIMEQL